MDRYIVSPLVIEVVIQEDEWKQAEFERRAGSEPLDDLPRTQVFFVRVGPHQVEVELIGMGFGEEISPAGEGFQIEELVFFDPMDGFHVALVGMRRRRDAPVLAAAHLGGKAGGTALGVVAADEFAAVIGLPDQVAQRDPVAVQMALDAGGENRAGRRTAPPGQGPEQQPTADLASRVLDSGQAELLDLRPVMRNIVEILGVRADLLEQPPSSFDRGEVLLALIFSAAPGDQTVPMPDALGRCRTDRKIELAAETGGTEGGEFAAEGQHLLLDLGRSLVRTVVRGAAALRQSRQALLLESPQPLPHGGNGGGELARRFLNALVLSRAHQTQVVVEGVFHFTHQIEIRDGSHAAARGPAPPPSAGPQTPLSTRSATALSASHSNTASLLGGYDVPCRFQTVSQP